jgi:hypothetical protein
MYFKVINPPPHIKKKKIELRKKPWVSKFFVKINMNEYFLNLDGDVTFVVPGTVSESPEKDCFYTPQKNYIIPGETLQFYLLIQHPTNSFNHLSKPRVIDLNTAVAQCYFDSNPFSSSPLSSNGEGNNLNLNSSYLNSSSTSISFSSKKFEESNDLNAIKRIFYCPEEKRHYLFLEVYVPSFLLNEKSSDFLLKIHFSGDQIIPQQILKMERIKSKSWLSDSLSSDINFLNFDINFTSTNDISPLDYQSQESGGNSSISSSSNKSFSSSITKSKNSIKINTNASSSISNTNTFTPSVYSSLPSSSAVAPPPSLHSLPPPPPPSFYPPSPPSSPPPLIPLQKPLPYLLSSTYTTPSSFTNASFGFRQVSRSFIEVKPNNDQFNSPFRVDSNFYSDNLFFKSSTSLSNFSSSSSASPFLSVIPALQQSLENSYTTKVKYTQIFTHHVMCYSFISLLLCPPLPMGREVFVESGSVCTTSPSTIQESNSYFLNLICANSHPFSGVNIHNIEITTVLLLLLLLLLLFLI